MGRGEGPVGTAFGAVSTGGAPLYMGNPRPSRGRSPGGVRPLWILSPAAFEPLLPLL